VLKKKPSAKSIINYSNSSKRKLNFLPRHWIKGQGWGENRLKEPSRPTKEEQAEAHPNNPVILYREAAMICAANTKAIQLAKITQQTPTPPGGTIDKTVEGELIGVFRDAAANLIWQAVPEPTEDELLEAAAQVCQKIFQAGITSIVWLVISESELSIIRRLHEQDRLLFRVNVVVPR
jgi:predicted amidohydrolase YtcJ